MKSLVFVVNKCKPCPYLSLGYVENGIFSPLVGQKTYNASEYDLAPFYKFWDYMEDAEIQAMKEFVLASARELLKPNNQVTTLEIKNYLRQIMPLQNWEQSFVSNVMTESDEFDFVSNGTFKIYSLKTQKDMSAVVVKKVSKTELCNQVINNKGKFITVVHTKKDGTTNLMNCQFVGVKEPLGLYEVKEQKQIKTFYPKDLKEVRVNGIKYILK